MAPAPIAPVVVTDATTTIIAEDHAHDMRRLLAKATNVDECRLIFDMFLAKSGVPVEPTTYDVPYPSPSTSSDPHPSAREPSEVALELSLVELFLGGDVAEPQPAPRKRRTKKKSEPAPAAAVAAVTVAEVERPAEKPAVAPIETQRRLPPQPVPRKLSVPSTPDRSSPNGARATTPIARVRTPTTPTPAERGW
jgi:hypothetical protein